MAQGTAQSSPSQSRRHFSFKQVGALVLLLGLLYKPPSCSIFFVSSTMFCSVIFECYTAFSAVSFLSLPAPLCSLLCLNLLSASNTATSSPPLSANPSAPCLSPSYLPFCCPPLLSRIHSLSLDPRLAYLAFPGPPCSPLHFRLVSLPCYFCCCANITFLPLRGLA